MKVEIRPIERKKFHLKEGKDSFTKDKVLEVLVNAKTYKYETGLTPEDIEMLSKQMPGVDLSDNFNELVPHPYWTSKAASIRLPNSTLLLDTNIPANYIKWKNLKASRYVANNMKEYEEGMWPDATHVIYDEAEDAQTKATKAEKKMEAYSKVADMSSEVKANIIRILEGRPVKKATLKYINGEIADIIESKVDDFLKYANMDVAEVNIRSVVLEAISSGVLNKEAGGAIFYMGEQIAYSYEEAITWFKHPDNQKMKVAILEKVQTKG